MIGNVAQHLASLPGPFSFSSGLYGASLRNFKRRGALDGAPRWCERWVETTGNIP